MYRQPPVSSKILTRRWVEKDQEMHIRKIIDMQPTLTVREKPKRFTHLKLKQKKKQLLEGKLGKFHL